MNSIGLDATSFIFGGLALLFYSLIDPFHKKNGSCCPLQSLYKSRRPSLNRRKDAL